LAAGVTDSVPNSARAPGEDGRPIIVIDVRPDDGEQTDPASWKRYYKDVLLRERVLVLDGGAEVAGPRWADFCRVYTAVVPWFDSGQIIGALRREAVQAAQTGGFSVAINNSTPSPAPANEAMTVVHPAGSARQQETPPDGAIRDSRIWLKGKPYRLATQLRSLLNYLLANPGAPQDAVIRHFAYSDSSHLHKRLKDLRDKLASELKKSGWRLQIKTEEGLISCKWEATK
jgi:hypothetical protein